MTASPSIHSIASPPPLSDMLSEAEQRAAEQVHVDLTKRLCQGAECCVLRELGTAFFAGWLSVWS